jgi:BASS family bile acid:Na+ symporter
MTIAILTNFAVTSVVTLALLLLFRVRPMASAEFLNLAVCPGAPFGPSIRTIARERVAISVALMVIPASTSAILSPLLLCALLPLVARNEILRVNAGRLIAMLLVSQLLPWLAALVVRQWRPNLAAGLQRPANPIVRS